MQQKLIVFSAVLFLSIFIVGSIAYMILMEQNLVSRAGTELSGIIGTEQVRLEASVNREIGIVLNVANSPLIKRYFDDPENPELMQMAHEEFSAFEQIFSSGMVFWVNNIDKVFHFSGRTPYVVDPEHPDNYWYYRTLYSTTDYNFNINYNPELDMMNLWINAPVFDNDHNPIGMIGGGINLTEFIDAMYERLDVDADLFLFNSDREITGAEDMHYVENKTVIDEKLGQIGSAVLDRIKTIEKGETIFFEPHYLNGVVVLGSIPSLDWYITAVHKFNTGDSLRNSMTVLFIVMSAVMLTIILVFNIFATKLLRESELAKSRVEAANETIRESINYAGKIQKNLLPSESVFEEAFSDYSIIWKPRDIVGGDIYWAKNFEDGTVLCICDCTGHGTPGAFLTMLVVSAFESIVTENNHKDTAQILYMLDHRLASVLHVDSDEKTATGIMDIKDGCDLAVLFISKDGCVTLSAGNINVYVSDGNEVTRHRGQSIFTGEGALKSKDDVNTTVIPANSDNKYYISSDGLFDQIGGEKGRRFGTKAFQNIILENHDKKQAEISSMVWEAFEEYRGDEPRRDDFEFFTFKP